MKLTLYKPSVAITTNMKLTAIELDIVDHIMKKTFDQIKEESNPVIDLEVSEISRLTNKAISTKKELIELTNKLYENEYSYNILGKDKSVKAYVKSRFISDLIIYPEEAKIGVVLGGLLLDKINNMVEGLRLQEKDIHMTNLQEKKEIKKKLDNLKLFYSKIDTSKYKDIKFYPSRVIYQLLEDYKMSEIPVMDIENFRSITNTVNKYQSGFKAKVLDKIKEDLITTDKIIDFEIIRKNRKISKIKILKGQKNISKREERKEIINRYLKACNYKYIKDLNKQHRKILNLMLEKANYRKIR